MTKFNLKPLLLLLAASPAIAATWSQQDGFYSWYKVGTINKYLLDNAVDSVVPTSYVKQSGSYIQCRSKANSVKYLLNGYDCNTGKPTLIKCEAFMCKDDFGITFDLTKNSVITCPRVTITKEQIALIYEGSQANIPFCH